MPVFRACFQVAAGGVEVSAAYRFLNEHDIIVALSGTMQQLQQLEVRSLALRLVLVASAGLCEEFIFRAYAVEELTRLVRLRWLAALLALFFFAVGHIGLYGWSAALLIPATAGAVLMGLYLWRRNLYSGMLAHVLLDGLFLIVVPALSHAG